MIKFYIKKIIKEADDFPSLPGSIVEIMSMANDPDFSMKKISDKLSKDAALVARILKIVNSVFYGLAKNISDIHQACTILGIRVIRNILLTLFLLNMFPSKNKKEYTYLFKKSLCAAIAADLICELTNPKLRSDAFVAGLLHNIGMYIFVRYLPEQYPEVLTEAEKRGLNTEIIENELFGINYLEAGSIIAKRWNLPDVIIYTTEYLQNPEKFDEKFLPINTRTVVQAAFLGSMASDIFFGWNKAYKISQFKLEMTKISNSCDHNPEDILASLPELINDSKQSYNLEIESIPAFNTVRQYADVEFKLLNTKYEDTYRELKKIQVLHESNEKKLELLKKQVESAASIITKMK